MKAGHNTCETWCLDFFFFLVRGIKRVVYNLFNFVHLFFNTSNLLFFRPTRQLFNPETLCLSLGYNYHHLNVKMIL